MNLNTQTLSQLAPFIKLAKSAKRGQLTNQDALSSIFSFLGIDGVDVNDKSSCETAISQALAKFTGEGKISKDDAKALIEFAKTNSQGKKEPKDLLPLLPTIGKLVGIDPSLMSMVEVALM